MKYLLLLLLPVFLSAQGAPFGALLFQNPSTQAISTADTVGSITLSDSVEVKLGANGPWKLLTSTPNASSLITGANKTTESTVMFSLSGESWWTYVNELTVRIYSTGQDTATSFPIFIPKGANGAVTLEVVCDTVGAAVHYSNSRIYGN